MVRWSVWLLGAVMLAGCEGPSGSSYVGGAAGAAGAGGSATTSSSSSSGTTSTAATSTSSSGSASCPSYAGEVAAILGTYCVSCHGPGGQESDKPLDTWANASAWSNKMASEVNAGKMPPKSSTALPSAAEETLLAWISCGSPDN